MTDDNIIPFQIPVKPEPEESYAEQTLRYAQMASDLTAEKLVLHIFSSHALAMLLRIMPNKQQLVQKLVAEAKAATKSLDNELSAGAAAKEIERLEHFCQAVIAGHGILPFRT